jgi:hypothetical protein
VASYTYRIPIEKLLGANNRSPQGLVDLWSYPL